mmetsp:Transcript_31855/g.62704  ORF Transcript_31855/g.62704 Transcript_31855/m.62704 type:complete len:88 (-) Transcript_31855:464-727(-)
MGMAVGCLAPEARVVLAEPMASHVPCCSNLCTILDQVRAPITRASHVCDVLLAFLWQAFEQHKQLSKQQTSRQTRLQLLPQQLFSTA